MLKEVLREKGLKQLYVAEKNGRQYSYFIQRGD
jgi:hypothetical protein